MATREIGAKLTLDGEAAFRQQMSAVERNLKTLKSEMSATTSSFQDNKNSMEALQAKQDVLNRQIEQQRVLVEALSSAMEESIDLHGENSAATDKWAQRLNYAKTQLNNMESQLRQTNDAMEDARVANEDLGDAMDGAETEGGLLGGAIESLVGKFDLANLTIPGVLGAIGAGLKEIYDQTVEVIEETDAYRDSLIKLQISAGLTETDTSDPAFVAALERAYYYTQDMEASMSVINQLLAAGFDVSQLEHVVGLLGGATVSLPGTDVVGLAEELQKNILEGELSGQLKEILAPALHSAGLSADVLQEGMAAEWRTVDQRASLMASYMDMAGLDEFAQQFEAATAAQKEASDAQFELEQAKVAYAEATEEIVLGGKTFWTDLKASLLENFLAMDAADAAGFVQTAMTAEASGGWDSYYEARRTDTEELSAAMDEYVAQTGEQMAQIVQIMDSYDNAYAAGIQNVQGLIDGANEMAPLLNATYSQLQRDALAALGVNSGSGVTHNSSVVINTQTIDQSTVDYIYNTVNKGLVG